MKKTTLASSILLALISSSTIAQTVDRNEKEQLDEVVVIGSVSNFGATKSEVPILETPRSLSIISEDEFLERGALTLDDTLSYTAGAVGNAFGYSTRGDFVDVRGLDAQEYQDNLQVIFGFFNNARADIYTLEQVEVLKGPASVLYGQGTPGGIISTVSKKAGRDNLDDEISFTFGSNDRAQVSADFGFALTEDGRWSARVVSLVRESDTQVDFVEDNAVVVSPSITYETDNTKLTALFNYTDRESDTASQFLPLAVTACASSDVTITGSSVCANAPGVEVDPSVYVGDPNFNKFDSEAETFSLFASHKLSDVVSFDATARYRDNEADYQQTWITFLGDGVPRVDANGNSTFGLRSFFGGPGGTDQFAFDARLKFDFDTGLINHKLFFGANYQEVNEFSNQFFVVAPTTFNILNPVYDGSELPTDDELNAARFLAESETESTDFYAVDQLTIGESLFVNLGIRSSTIDSSDAFNDQEDTETPISIGALYKSDFGLNPYFNYSESFLATVGTDVVTGSALLPREGEQFELGVKYQPEGSNNFVTLAYFDLEQNNFVTFVATGQTQSGNSVEVSGIELEARFQLGELAFDLNVSNIDADDIDASGVESELESTPDTNASLWMSWQPEGGAFDNFTFGSGVRYASSNESNGVDPLTGSDYRIVTDSYTVVDSTVGYKGFDNIDLSLNIRNLFDDEYYSTCLVRGDCFPAEGRTVVATATYRF